VIMKLNETQEQMINRCSRCGSCQAHCPLYLATGVEPLVARGKVELLEHLIEGRLEWNDKLAEVFSTCLLCGNCGDNCPNQVRVDHLVREARRDLVAARGLPVIKRTVFQQLLKNDGRLSAAARLVCFYQRSGIQRLVRAGKVLNLLPGGLTVKESLLPRLAAGEFRKLVPRVNRGKKSTLRVAYFTGCMTNYVFHRTGRSVLNLLTGNGVEVTIPEQGCCGLPALAAGDYDTAGELARRNIAGFTQSEPDYIVVDCASCLGTLLEYPRLFDDGGTFARAEEKVMDISRFLVEVLDIKLPPATKDAGIVTYHDPCHLKRTPGGKEYPRALLKMVSGPRFVELPADAGRCCGSAGSFNLEHYRLSREVVKPKIRALEVMQPDIIATGCPACMLHLEHAIKDASLPTRVVHTVELLNILT